MSKSEIRLYIARFAATWRLHAPRVRLNRIEAGFKPAVVSLASRIFLYSVVSPVTIYGRLLKKRKV